MLKQMKKDGNIIEGCVGIQPVFEILKVEAPVNESLVAGKFKDDITGQLLNDSLVVEARAKEMTYFASKGVWIKKPRAEAFEKTGRPPISVRWVDVNKGDDECPKYRSRLVARQLKATDKSGDSFFSPTAPLEALRAVLSVATTHILRELPSNPDPGPPEQDTSVDG